MKEKQEEFKRSSSFKKYNTWRSGGKKNSKEKDGNDSFEADDDYNKM